MQRERSTVRRYAVGICEDCGRYVQARAIPGVAPHCPRCGSFRVLVLAVLGAQPARVAQ